MHMHHYLLTFVAFVSELLGTLAGFGSSTFFVPAASLIEGFQFVLALTAILHCFGNLSRIYLFRKYFEWKNLTLLIIPTLVFTVIGALLTISFSTQKLLQILGVMLMVVALISFFEKKWIKRMPKSLGVFLGIVSGFTSGLIGTGGAIRGVALTALNMQKNSFIITSAAIDIGSDFLRAGIYIYNGFMIWSHWFYIPLLGVAAYLGAKLGQALINKINQKQFEKIVAIFVFLSGLLMLLEIKA